MPSFVKKRVIIDAEQWFPGKLVNGVEFVLAENCLPCKLAAVSSICVHLGRIKTLEDTEDSYHYVSPGDWVITGVKGEKYACKPDIFEMTYEPIKED